MPKINIDGGSERSGMPTLLVADSRSAVLHLFRRTFEKQDELVVLTATSSDEVLSTILAVGPDVVAVSVALPSKSGVDLLYEIHEIDAKLPVILITDGEASSTAIDAMKRGAFDYATEPLHAAKLREVLYRALEMRRLMTDPVGISDSGVEPAETGDMLIGRSDGMRDVYKAIGRVAPQNVTVVIRGESGSGKELVARAIYQHSDRDQGPFLAVNCAAIPEALLESELFGHEKGAFTGAERRRIGKFEQCNGGTLFLDEIGDMSPSLQSKMLRVLQEQNFERVGGNETIRTDVRIIAATHHDLERMSAEGRFRSDLYYRINVFCIDIPPLRKRKEDLPLLVEHFLIRSNQELSRNVRSVADDALTLLRDYSWPGNVRELQSVLKQSVLKSNGPVLLSEFLPEAIRGTRRESVDPANAATQLQSSLSMWPQWDEFVRQRVQRGSLTIYDEAVSLTEKQVITRVLHYTNGNQAQAAQLLGITRSTLRSKLRLLRIFIGRTVEAIGDSE